MARSVESSGNRSRFIALASFCLVVAALYFGSEVLVPLALAILFSFLLSPVVHWLERIHLPRTVATLTVVLIGMALVVSFGYLVGDQMKNTAEQLPHYQTELQQKISALRSHVWFFRKAEQEIHNMGVATAPATHPAAPASQPAAASGGLEAAANPLTAASPSLAGSLATGGSPATQPAEAAPPIPVRLVPPETAPMDLVRDYATKFLSPLATAGLVLVLVIFMLLTREDLRDRIIRLVGHGHMNLTTQALDDAGNRISRYLGALAIVNGCYGLCVAGGLWVIGHLLGHGHPFPNVLVWGLLVGVFRFVPYVGIWIGAAVPLLLSFAIFPGSGVFFAVVGLFVALEIVVGQFIEPFWYGSSTGMSALAVLVAAIFWTWLWGGIGLLLSTPLTVCLVVMGKYVPQLRFLDILLGDEPALPPPVRMYQRLIASDEEEAADLARELLKTQPLESVYDDVMLPTLALAEHDSHRGRLDPERLAFVRQSMRDMVDELGEVARDKQKKQAADHPDAASEAPAPTPDMPRQRPSLPRDCSINVLILPAKNESDEIVGAMLKQLIEMRGYCGFCASVDSLASEMVAMIEQQHAQIVCVSAMPPAAVAHARYLCKKIDASAPDMPRVVGVWLSKADPERIRQRIACSDATKLVISLAQAQEQIDQISQSPSLRHPAPAATAQ